MIVGHSVQMLPLVFAILGCSQPDYVCIPVLLPRMTLSDTEVHLGYVEREASAVATVTLANEGEGPLGIDAIHIGDWSEFQVGWDVTASDCAWVPPADASRARSDVDTGSPPPDTGDEEVPPPEVLFVLPPGCSVPLTVEYTPWTSSDASALDALIVESAGDSTDAGRWYSDFEHATQVAWLTGSSEAGTTVPSGIATVGDVIALERTAVHAGDTTRAEVRVNVPGGGGHTTTWSSEADVGTFDAYEGDTVRYTAPATVECQGSSVGIHVSLYAVSTDSDGNQDWAWTKLSVYDQDVTLDGTCPGIADPTPCD